MGRRHRRRDVPRPTVTPSASVFAEALEENEEHMGEGAAMAVTCQMFGISEEEGFDLLISLADGEAA